MRRSFVLPIAIVLASITGAILSTTVSLLNTPVITAPNSPAVVAVVDSFYQTINDVLRTGNASALNTSVASDFIDHVVAPGSLATRDELARELLALRSIFPALHIVLDDVVAMGNHAAARIHMEDATDGEFLGYPIDAEHIPLGPIDFLVIADNQIVERWGTPTGLSVELFGTAWLQTFVGTSHMLSLAIMTFPVQSEIEMTSGEGVTLLVPAFGELAVTILPQPTKPVQLFTGDSEQPRSIAVNATVTLNPSTILTVSDQTTVRLNNDTDAEMSIIVVTISPPAPENMWSTRVEPIYNPPAERTEGNGFVTFPHGMSLQRLTTSQLPLLPTNPAATIGRISLSPGEDLPPQATKGDTMIAVTSGSLELETGIDRVWVRRGATGASGEESRPTLGVGDGAYVRSGTFLELRNSSAEPVTFIILSVLSLQIDPV